MKVFFYVPNLIGYVRAALLVACAVYFREEEIVQVLYSLNVILDGVDGMAARYFHQESRFGYCLDMILDRIGSAMLFCLLTSNSPSPVWILLMFLDLSSHWFMTLSTRQHKLQRYPWIKLYYSYLGIVCLMNEVFLISFLHHFTLIVAAFSFPFFAFKQVINCIQLGVSCYELCNEEFAI